MSAVFLLRHSHVWYMYAGTNSYLKSRAESCCSIASPSGLRNLVTRPLSSAVGHRGASVYSFKRGYSRLVRPVFQMRKIHNADPLKVLMEAKTTYDGKLARATLVDYFPPLLTRLTWIRKYLQ